MKSRLQAASAVLITLESLIAGCGGGGGGGSDAVQPPSITAQPANASAITGDTATFSVTVQGSSPSYQWSRNGVGIIGAVASSYTTPPVAYGDDGATYTVAVKNAGGAVTSTSATLHLALSADQHAFEALALGANAGSYEFAWNLNPDPTSTQVANTDWLQSDYSQLSQSPLTHGPQLVVQSMPLAASPTLPVVTPAPSRELVNGAILVVPTSGAKYSVSYHGSAVQVDVLADDGTTVAYSQLRSGFAAHDLSGALSTTPDEFALPYNAIFTNTNVLDQTQAWQPGSQYVVYTSIQNGDRYTVFDCLATTTGSAPSPCVASTTLNAAMTAGQTSSSDGVTYHLADGQVSTIGGVPVWIATAPRPASAIQRSTVEYRVYFELGGNVYTGALVRNNTSIGGGYYASSGGTVYTNYQVRLNKAARDSVAAAVRF